MFRKISTISKIKKYINMWAIKGSKMTKKSKFGKQDI